MSEIKIYTDGSCLGNPGAGGYAAIIIDEKNNCVEIVGGEPKTTNNRMELMAAIEALKKVSADDLIELSTDSSYLKNAFTQGWLANWKRNGWITSNGTPVLNVDLWKKLDALMFNRSVKFNWVKGHAGNKFNERCDKLARTEATKQKNHPAKISEDNFLKENCNKFKHKEEVKQKNKTAEKVKPIQLSLFSDMDF